MFAGPMYEGELLVAVYKTLGLDLQTFGAGKEKKKKKQL